MVITFIEELLSKPYVETIVLSLTAITTFVMYKIQKRSNIRDAARTIIMQIDIANNRLDALLNIIGTDISRFDLDRFWQSEDVIDINEWNKYRHLFVKRLHYNEIVSLTNYFDNVVLIGKQQKEIKRLSLEMHIHNMKSGKKDSEIEIPTLLFMTIQNQYLKIHEQKNAIPYEQLKIIADL